MFVRLSDDNALTHHRDVLVIGSGPAGLALADALGDEGVSVTVLEAGDRTARRPPAHPEVVNEGLSFSGAVAGRRFAYGGTGEIWAGQCLPLDVIDFEERSWVPGSGWPLRPRELEPWVRQALRLYQLDGAAFTAKDIEQGPLPVPQFQHDQLSWVVPHYSPGHRLGQRLRPKLARSQSVTVYLGATAHEVTIEESTATAVKVVDGRLRTHKFLAPIIVLAAGTLETTRLLLASNIENRSSSAYRLGHGLQDHPYWLAAEVTDLAPEVGQLFQSMRLHGVRLRPKLALGARRQRELETLNAVMDLELSHGHDSALGAAKRLHASLGQRRASPTLASDLIKIAASPIELLREGRTRLWGIGGPPDHATRVFVRVQTEQPPLGPSKLELVQYESKWASDLAVTWQVGEFEQRTCIAAVETFKREIERLGAAKVQLFDWVHDLSAFRRNARDFYHPAGTTRMSEAPSDGVVDTNLRVHGVSNLYVASGSVFPTSGHAHPTLTIVALAIRLANHLTSSKQPLHCQK